MASNAYKSSMMGLNPVFGALLPTAQVFPDLGSALDRGAYNQSPLLSAAERRGFVDAGVARGEDRQPSIAGATHAVRSGDARRRKEAEKQRLRELQGSAMTNKHLADIYSLLYDNLESDQ